MTEKKQLKPLEIKSVDWIKFQLKNSIIDIVTDGIVSVKELGEQKAFDMAAKRFKELRSNCHKENP